MGIEEFRRFNICSIRMDNRPREGEFTLTGPSNEEVIESVHGRGVTLEDAIRVASEVMDRERKSGIRREIMIRELVQGGWSIRASVTYKNRDRPSKRKNVYIMPSDDPDDPDDSVKVYEIS